MVSSCGAAWRACWQLLASDLIELQPDAMGALDKMWLVLTRLQVLASMKGGCCACQVTPSRAHHKLLSAKLFKHHICDKRHNCCTDSA